MPLPNLTVKGTIFMQQGGNGFTESWWWRGLNTDLNTQAAYLLNVVNKRRVLLGVQGSIHAYRVSFESGAGGEPVLGDSFLNYYGQNGFSTEASDAPTTALLCTWRDATAQRRKQQFMRGIWDNIVTDGGAYASGYGTWQTKFDQWLAALQAGTSGVKSPGVSWLRRVRVYPNTITNYVSDADSYVTFTVANAIPAYVAGPPASGVPRDVPVQVRITKLNTRSLLNGTQQVIVISNNTFRTVQPIAAGAFKIAGGVAFYDPTLIDVGTVPLTGLPAITAMKIVERKVGTPLLELRGRLKAKPKV